MKDGGCSSGIMTGRIDKLLLSPLNEGVSSDQSLGGGIIEAGEQISTL